MRLDRDHEVSTLGQFIAYIKKVKSTTRDFDEEYWYRGQRDANWFIQPSLYREAANHYADPKLKQVADQWKANFLDSYRLFSKYVRNNPAYSKLSKFEILFMAQHHGLPTPLVDWTTEPLVALFFALDGNGENSEPQDARVTILRTHLLDNQLTWKRQTGDGQYRDYIPNEPINVSSKELDQYLPTIIDATVSLAQDVGFAAFSELDFEYRIARQAGKFTVFGPQNRFFEDFQRINMPVPYTKNSIDTPSEDNFFNVSEEIIIPKSRTAYFKDILHTLGIDSNSMYGKDDELDLLVDSVWEDLMQIALDEERELRESGQDPRAQV